MNKFAVQNADDFIAGRPTPQPPRMSAAESARIDAVFDQRRERWDSIWKQRPKNVSIEAWCCFVNETDSKFPSGVPVTVRKLKSGRLVALGTIKGNRAAFLWPENHLIDEINALDSEWLEIKQVLS